MGSEPHSLHPEEWCTCHQMDTLGGVLSWIGSTTDVGPLRSPDRDRGTAAHFAKHESSAPGLPSRRGRGQEKETRSYCGIIETDKTDKSRKAAEDLEWGERQQLTGVSARIIFYMEGEVPQDEFLLRGGGADGAKILVLSVREAGKAYAAGIRAGDVLASIDGKKDFQGKTASTVHASLRAPVTLVFMGFIGKLQAEVRLNFKEESCGISPKVEVAVGRPEAPVQVVDEVVFDPRSASLFISSENRQTAPACLNAAISGDDGAVGVEDMDEFSKSETVPPRKPELIRVYELGANEARNMVNRVLKEHSILELEQRCKAQTEQKHFSSPSAVPSGDSGDEDNGGIYASL